MPSPIRLGDSTSHGGSVTSATSKFTAMGIAVAVVGDSCSCPKPGHSNCKISEGDPNWTIDGKAVALDGHKTSCGATLIASIPNMDKS